MKFFATVLAASIAVATAAAADCEISTLQGLVTSPDVSPCTADSGYALIPPNAPPTDAQVAKMCKSKACMSLVTSVLATKPAECKIPLGGNIMLRADLLDKVSNACKAPAPGPGPAPAPAPAPAPGAGPSPVVTPALSTVKPAC